MEARNGREQIFQGDDTLLSRMMGGAWTAQCSLLARDAVPEAFSTLPVQWPC